MQFTLIDDGTLDTVVKCDKCGYEMRYNAASCAVDYRDVTGALNFRKFVEEVIIPDHIDSGECEDTGE